MRWTRKVAVVMLGLTLSMGIVGCKKNPPEEPQPPTITFTTDQGYVYQDVTVAPGTVLRIGVTACKGNNAPQLSSFTFRIVRVSGVTETIVQATKINADCYRIDTAVVVGQTPGTEKWIVEATDKDGRTTTRTLNITIQAAQVITPAFYQGITFTYADNVTQTDPNGQAFLNTDNGQLYTESQASANAASIDMGYFYSPSSKHNLASPADMTNSNIYYGFTINWGQVQLTIRKTNLTTTDFNNLQSANQDTLINFFNNGTDVIAKCIPPGQNSSDCQTQNVCTGTRLNISCDNTALNAGTIYAIKIVRPGGVTRYGLIKINGANAGGGQASLSIDVLVQR